MIIRGHNLNRVELQAIKRADGTDGTGLTPTVRIRKDGQAWANATNSVVEGEDGTYNLLLTASESDCDFLAVKMTEGTIITQTVNLYPVDMMRKKISYRYTNNATGAGYDEVTVDDPPGP